MVQLDSKSGLKIVVPSLLRQALNGILDEPLRPGRIVPERIIEMDGLDSTLEFVAITDWVALLPAAAIYNRPTGVDVRFNAIAGNEITVQYSVVHACTEPLSPAATAFIDLAATELSSVAAGWRPAIETRSSRRRSLQLTAVPDAAASQKYFGVATRQPVQPKRSISPAGSR